MWLILLVTAFSAWVYYHMVHKPYPPGPMPLPLIGNMHSLGAELKDWPDQLNKWGEEYGGVYTIWIPMAKVIVTKYDMHKEAFTGNNGEKTAARPKSWTIAEMFGGNYGLFLPEGHFWREQRRFTLHVLRDLGFARTGIMEEKIQYDVDRLMAWIDKTGTKESDSRIRINLDTPIATCLASVINEMSSGKRYDFDDEYFQKFFKLNRDMFALFSDTSFMILDGFPILANTPFFKDFQVKFKEVIKNFYEFFNKDIQEHKAEIRANPDMEAHDLVAAYIKEMDRRTEKGEDMDTFSEYQLFATIFDLWSAGMETSTVSLRWMFLMMCKHPEIQTEVRQEMKRVVGDRIPSIKDQLEMPLTRAVINETWRFISFFPVSADRRAVENISIGGHSIPKDTAINMHIDGILRDPLLFPNPEVFDPYRFINKDGTYNTALADKVAIFGMGRRQCVGEGLARMNILLVFTSILQKYKLSLPSDLKNDPSVEVQYFFTKMPGTHETILERD